MSVNSKMTAIADEIRELSGTTEAMGLDAMATHVGDANNEVDTQANLIAQIRSTLENKAAGSGGIDTSDATATANDILANKTAYVDGEKITGTIATKTSSNLSASGATVTVPAGYYASQATKSVTTATRAETTMTVTADDTNDKLTITASNNQGTGYVTGANKTATKTVTLTASGATVTASDGSNSVSKSVSTATQATPSVSIDANGKITASATQTAGYVTAGTKSGTKQMTTQAAKTVTPTTSEQTAVAKNVYTTGVVKVGAIPSNYEDVTTETEAYTTKLTTLETAITALENELQGKASGGSGGGEMIDITISGDIPVLYFDSSNTLQVSPTNGNISALNGIIFAANNSMNASGDYVAMYAQSVSCIKFLTSGGSAWVQGGLSGGGGN